MNTDKFPFSARSHYAKQNSSRHAAQFCLVKCLRIIHESKVGRMTLQLFNEIWWELSDPPIHPKIGWSWWSDNANFLDFQQISGWEGKTFPTCPVVVIWSECRDSVCTVHQGVQIWHSTGQLFIVNQTRPLTNRSRTCILVLNESPPISKHYSFVLSHSIQPFCMCSAAHGSS